MQLRSALQAAAVAVGLALATSPTTAQDFPSKPINIIVAFGAGGGTDAFVRALAEPLSQSLGQPVLVTNRPGAGGGVAAMAIKASPADGYTLIATGSVTYTFEPQVLKTQYALDDFEHIAITALFQDGLFTHPSRPYKSMKDIIAAAKAEKRSIKYASQFQLDRLIFTYVAKKEGVEIVPVPTQGGNGAVQAVLANQVDFGFSGGTFGPHVESGALRLIGAMSADRMERFPDIPSMKDNGWTVGSENYIVISGPKGMPAPVLDKLAKAIEAGSKQEGPRNALRSRYIKELYHGPGNALKVLQEQAASFKKMIEDQKQ